ncbi:MAG: siderophore-interacting protein, partial [Actinomycetota bacterium]
VVRVRHDFAGECDTIDAVRVEFFGLLNAAREWIGDDLPLTSLERELTGGEFTTFVTEVAALVDVAPNLRQITFRRGLEGFESLGGDQFLYVLLPPPGRTELTVDEDFSWLAYDEMPEAERPAGAYYSVRAWRPETHELDMWFVLHGDAGASSAWASRAIPGQPVALWGPRRSFDPPARTGSYLLVTDETGFGAVAAVLDELLAADPDVVATVIAESDGADGRVPLPKGRHVSVKWVDRSGAEPGTTSLLLDAVRTASIANDVYAFGAGESRRITEVRKHLRDHVGLPAEQVSMTGYWRAAS